MTTIRPRRVLVLVNPAAGPRRGRDEGERVARAVARAGVRCELERTRAPGDLSRGAAAARGEGFDLVLVVGGDGTVHEAAQGIAGSGVALGVAPAGTMNLLARVLGIPLDAARAAELLVRAGTRLALRPGRAGDRLFVLMAGIGFDAWVLRAVFGGARGKVAMRHYAAGALAALGTYRFPEIRFDTDGGERLRATSGVVGRAPLYGGWLRPTPRARLDRDLLELCAVRGRSGREYLRMAPSLWSGGHVDRADAESRLVTGVRAASDDPDVPVQTDGEIAGALPMEFGLSDRVLVLAT